MAKGDSDCYCSMVRRRTAPVANLAPRRGERPLMVVRHDGDQRLAIVGHTCSMGNAVSVAHGAHPLYVAAHITAQPLSICTRAGSSRSCWQTTARHPLRHGYGHFRPRPRCWQFVASRSKMMRIAAAPISCVEAVDEPGPQVEVCLGGEIMTEHLSLRH
jgi:hypothetical protein